jgi:hypothetical protein
MERAKADLLRAERLIRQHIQTAVNSRRIEPYEAARKLSDLIETGHPNKRFSLLIGAKMQAEKRLGINSHSEQLSCAY